jgi:hypothetical protein
LCTSCDYNFDCSKCQKIKKKLCNQEKLGVIKKNLELHILFS